MNRYGKAISAVAYFALVAAYAAISGDNRIEPDEAVAIAIAGVNAVAVYVMPLAPDARWAKTAINVLLGVLQVLATVILGGLDSNESILLALTAANLVGGGALTSVSDNGVSSKSPVAPPASPEPGATDIV